MKRFLVVLFSIVFVVTGVAVAGGSTITDPLEFGETKYVTDSLLENEITWEHTLLCCQSGAFNGFATGENGYYGEVISATITIVANDVDGPYPAFGIKGQDDYVYFNFDSGRVAVDQSNHKLEQFGRYNFKETGGNGDLVIEGADSTSTFDITFLFKNPTFSELLEGCDGVLPIVVDVDDDVSKKGWGTLIKSSTLEIECAEIPVPSTMLLLGSGVAGLVGLRRRFKKK